MKFKLTRTEVFTVDATSHDAAEALLEEISPPYTRNAEVVTSLMLPHGWESALNTDDYMEVHSKEVGRFLLRVMRLYSTGKFLAQIWIQKEEYLNMESSSNLPDDGWVKILNERTAIDTLPAACEYNENLLWALTGPVRTNKALTEW